MLYHLYFLRDQLSLLNIFGYISFRSLGAVLMSFFISLILFPRFISFLQSKKFKEVIRKDGPESHFKKSGTPSIGGVILITSVSLSSLLWCNLSNVYVLLGLLSLVLFGGIGLWDDYVKIKPNSSSHGFSIRKKFSLLIFVSFILVALVYAFHTNPTALSNINIPYMKNTFVNIGWLTPLFYSLVIVGSSNAVNFSDGLDGLATGLFLIAISTLLVFVYLVGHVDLSTFLKIQYIPQLGEFSVFIGSLIGSCLGLLWFNSYPSSIFMGDVGSLALGSMLGLTAIFAKQEILLLIIGGLFVIETCSVILQISTFKFFNKRRFLRMAPIHHHWELKGYPESKIVIRFWIVGLILSILALISLKVR